jgi:hypothetical protein
VIATSLAAVARALAATLLCACKVYLPACQPNEDPPVGVTGHRVEMDEDGGTGE